MLTRSRRFNHLDRTRIWTLPEPAGFEEPIAKPALRAVPLIVEPDTYRFVIGGGREDRLGAAEPPCNENEHRDPGQPAFRVLSRGHMHLRVGGKRVANDDGGDWPGH
jgi:hypothetical protein